MLREKNQKSRKKNQEDFPEEEKSRGVVQELFSMIIYMILVLVFTFLIVTFVGQRTQVLGSSMEYTLSDKDNLIVDKITYRFSKPERFDIIVFPYQHGGKIYYIKRIIGLPGETVQIQDKKIYINGEELVESYGREVMESPGLAEQSIQLGEDEYFVLGDNRNYSSDSRDPNVGNIKEEDIIGRAWLRIWPLQDFGILRHQ